MLIIRIIYDMANFIFRMVLEVVNGLSRDRRGMPSARPTRIAEGSQCGGCFGVCCIGFAIRYCLISGF